MGSLFRKLAIRSFYKNCKFLFIVKSCIADMNCLLQRESRLLDFSTYYKFYEALDKLVYIANHTTHFCKLETLDYFGAIRIKKFLAVKGSIEFLDSNAEIKLIPLDDAEKLPPINSTCTIINPYIGLTSDGYNERLAVHTSLINDYEACIRCFEGIYDGNLT